MTTFTNAPKTSNIALGTPPVELTSIAAIKARYELPGPHVTVVVNVPLPMTVGDDAAVRYDATRTELLHVGASEESVGHIVGFLESSRRRGHPVLVTATDRGAAFCWLAFDIAGSATVGNLPALLPALRQVRLGRVPMVGAVVDRTGADLFGVDAFDIEPVDSVTGTTEHIHKGAGGGLSHSNHQRHSEQIWARNAELVAAAITTQAAALRARHVVLTGDDRAVRLVEEHLDEHRVGTVVRRQAGGRHEPETPQRLRHAAFEVRASLDRQRTACAVDELSRELGQQDRALAGAMDVENAVDANEVKTLFVRPGTNDAFDADAIICNALAHGVDIVVDAAVHGPDGIAAVLRMPREQATA